MKQKKTATYIKQELQVNYFLLDTVTYLGFMTKRRILSINMKKDFTKYFYQIVDEHLFLT